MQDDRPALPSGLKVAVEAEDKALDALAQHIKNSGRAFSVFDAARLVLAGAERHRVRVECEPERLVGLFSVPADGALFESKEEAARHALRSAEVIAAYYQTDEVEVEEPKGAFTSIAVCGMSGELLGPPSHHSYQTSLKRTHTERYASLPFEEYRRRVRVESNPELVEKWKESQRKATRWTYLKGEVQEGQEPVSFTSRAEFEAHFRRLHGDDAVTEVREAVVHGVAKREQLSPGLGRLLRRHIEDAKKHMFEVSQKIAQGLERRGLKLFKRRGGKMFVSRVKPRAVAPDTVFSERIAAIVEAVKSDPGLQLGKLIEKFVPVPAPAEGASAEEGAASLSEDQKGTLRDVHWLAEEGYLIIYSDDVVFLGVQGEPPHHAPGAKTAEEASSSDGGDAQPAKEVPESSPPVPHVEVSPTEEMDEAAAVVAAEAASEDSNPSAAD